MIWNSFLQMKRFRLDKNGSIWPHFIDSDYIVESGKKKEEDSGEPSHLEISVLHYS